MDVWTHERERAKGSVNMQWCLLCTRGLMGGQILVKMITLICLKGCSLLVSKTEEVPPSHIFDAVSVCASQSPLTFVSHCEFEESSSSLTEVFTTTPPPDRSCCLELRASKCWVYSRKKILIN